MNFGRRKVPVEVYESLPVSVGKIMESCMESKVSSFETTKPTEDGEKTKKVLTDISTAVRETLDTSKVELITATKHPEVNFWFFSWKFILGRFPSIKEKIIYRKRN